MSLSVVCILYIDYGNYSTAVARPLILSLMIDGMRGNKELS